MDQLTMLTRRVYRLEQELAALKGAPLQDIDALYAPPPAPKGARTTTAPAEEAGSRKPSIAPEPQAAHVAFETEVAGKWFARIGAIALVIGAGFAFKYGVDRGYIGPGVRVALGVATGFALIVLSEWSKRRTYDVFAQAVAAAGTGLLFLSTWAAYHLYSFISAGPTFAALFAITVLLAGLAVRHNSPALAILATIAGFLDPLLVGGRHHPTALYGYLLVLDVGALSVATARRWTVPPFIAFFGTWILYSAGVDDASTPVAFWYATILFVLFCIPAFMRYQEDEEHDVAGAVITVASGAAYFAAGLSILARDNQNLQSVFAAALGGVALTAGLLTWMANRNRITATATVLFGQVVLAAAVGLRFHDAALPVAGALLAVAFVWVGRQLDLRLATWAGLVLMGYTGLSSVFGLYQAGTEYAPARLVFSAQAGSLVAQVVALYLIAAMLRGSRDEGLRSAWMPSAVAANVMTVVWMSFEAYARQRGLDAQPSSAFPFTLSAIWGLYAALLLIVGFAFRSRSVRLMSLGLFGITIVKMALVDLWTVSTGYRVIGFLGIGVLLLTASLTYHRFRALIVGDAHSAVSEP
jgi:uncharacterized membrane protein